MPKVLVLNPTMPPRAVALFSRLVTEDKFEWMFNFYSISSKIRRWKKTSTKIPFKYKILKTFDFGWYGKDFTSIPIPWNFPLMIISYRPDVVVIPGWADLPSFFSAIYCKLSRKKLVLRSESTRFEKSWRRTFFMPVTKFIIWASNSYLASGSEAKKYLISLGAKPEKIIIGYSTIDVEHFAKKSKIPKNKKELLRKKLNIPKNNFVILFNGQLIQRKGVYELLNSFKNLSKKYKNISLLFVGYGQEENNLKQLVKNYELSNLVIFTGFVENKLLPEYYSISDVFVLPSKEETWGMVVNEAMACGLPVVVGNRVGSSYDLIIPGKTGIIFDSKSQKQLENSLSYLIKNKGRAKTMGKSAQKKIKNYTLDHLSDAFINSIKTALN